MVSTQAKAPASVATAGWTSHFDLDPSGFRGNGKVEFLRFATDLQRELAKAPTKKSERERLIERARLAEPPSRGDWALVALADHLPRLRAAMHGWASKDIVTVVAALRERWTSMCNEERFNLDLEHVIEWTTEHEEPGRVEPETSEEAAARAAAVAEAVAACIAVDAPLEVRIIKRLTQTGSQKVVFAAKWTVADDPTEIVLKTFLAGMESSFARELRPHPLSMRHPNIIETYWLPNQARIPKQFLVERRLEPLSDKEKLSGESEAARLLVDLLRALTFLEDQGLVHGDIKPDNVAYSGGRYILLDFGICRPASEFERPSATATGSLRTRAPELFGDAKHSAQSDVWAVGATVFQLLFGRFPLWRLGDPPLPTQQADKSGEREKALQRLTRRAAEKNYDENLVELKQLMNKRLEAVLECCLERDPGKRPDARKLLSDCLEKLSALIGEQDGPLFAAKVELSEMRRYVSAKPEELALMSERERRDLVARVDVIQRALNAQRHYLRVGKKVRRSAREEMVSKPVAQSTQETVAVALGEIVGYVAPEDRRIDMELRAFRDRIRDDDVSASPGDEHDNDLVATLTSLAATAVGHREDVAEALDEFKAALPTRG